MNDPSMWIERARGTHSAASGNIEFDVWKICDQEGVRWRWNVYDRSVGRYAGFGYAGSLKQAKADSLRFNSSEENGR